MHYPSDGVESESPPLPYRSRARCFPSASVPAREFSLQPSSDISREASRGSPAPSSATLQSARYTTATTATFAVTGVSKSGYVYQPGAGL